MPDLKISEFAIPGALNNDAYLPVIQLVGFNETNYKITLDQLATQMEAKLGVPVYVKTWDANANVPALVSSIGTTTTIYVVNVAGSTTLNGISSWSVGDIAYFNGSVWLKILGTTSLSGTAPITYNGTTGAMGLDYNTTNLKITASQLNTIQDLDTFSTPTFAEIVQTEFSGLTGTIPFFQADGSLEVSTTFGYAATSFGIGVAPASINSKFQHLGTYAVGHTTVSASAATSSLSAFIIGVTLTSPQVTITLSTSDNVVGRMYEIKDQAGTANTTPIIISPQSGTIDGQSSLQINANYGIMRVYSDGTNWFTR